VGSREKGRKVVWGSIGHHLKKLKNCKGVGKARTRGEDQKQRDRKLIRKGGVHDNVHKPFVKSVKGGGGGERQLCQSPC